MNRSLFFNNKKYISTKEAGSLTGYSKDYIGQLARGNKIDSKKVGRVWYVGEESILKYNNLPNTKEPLPKNGALLEDLDKKILAEKTSSLQKAQSLKTPKTPAKKKILPSMGKLVPLIFGFLVLFVVFSMNNAGLLNSLVSSLPSNFLTANLGKILNPPSVATNYTTDSLLDAYGEYVLSEEEQEGKKFVSVLDTLNAYKNYIAKKISDASGVQTIFVSRPSPSSPSIITDAPLVTQSSLVSALRTLLSAGLPIDIANSLRGPQGPPGVSAPRFIPLGPPPSIVATPNYNNSGAIIGNSSGFASLGAQELIVSGNSTLSGSLAVTGPITAGSIVGSFNPSFTAGSVAFQGAGGLTEDSANFLWDDTNNYLGLGTSTPQSNLDVQGTAGTAGVLTLASQELTVVDGDVLGRIDFNAPLESSGTDAILAGASIWAEADDTFADDNNSTELVFATNTSAAATERMRIDSGGSIELSGDEADITFTGTGNHDITAGAGTLRLGSNTVIGNILALDNTIDIGTAGVRFDTIYADEVNASTLVGTLSTGNLSAETFNLNSDNATADTEDANLAFERGSSIPNALLTWDSTNDEFDLNSNLHLTGTIAADPYIIFDAATASDTDFWISLQEDAEGDDDDTLQIGKGTTPGTTPYLTLNKDGLIGINTTSPQSLLDVQGAAGAAGILHLASKELTVVDGDELGRINFNAPLESDGTDAILAGAAIWAEADDTFSATVNSTELVFGTNTSAAATERMRIDSAGNVGIGTSTPGSALEVTSGSFPVIDSIRTTTQTNATAGALRLIQSTTNDMVDGFGTYILFAGTDSGATAQPFGWIGGIRDGGDTEGALVFNAGSVGNEEFMRIDNDGNVGIGTASPESLLHILTTSGQVAEIYFGISGNTKPARISYANNENDLSFWTNDNERITIDSSGRVGIGTTTPISLFEIEGGLTTTGAVLTLGTKETSVVDADVLGKIDFYAPLDSAGGDAILAGAAIWAEADDTFSSTVNSTELVFATNTSAAATERMRIDSAGNVGIGTAAPTNLLTIYNSVDAAMDFEDANQRWVTGLLNSVTTDAYTIRDATAGVNVVTILNSSGNVGIGTASPASLLEIQGGLTTTGAVLTLGTKETTVVDGDVLGKIDFYAPLESDGSDAILAGAAIWAEADATFSATVNSTELVFGTNTSAAATERMRIDSAGSVGIGTSTPDARLHISDGTINTQNGAPTALITAANAVLTSEASTFAVQSTDSQAADLGGSINFGGRGTATNSFTFAHIAGRKENSTSGNYSGYLHFGTSDSAGDLSEYMRITSAGLVGIGTDTPSKLLHLESANSTASLFKNTGNTQIDVEFDAARTGANNNITRIRGLWNGTEVAQLTMNVGDDTVNEDEGYLTFWTKAGGGASLTEKMRLDKSGNLGIGTTSPASLLEIQGGLTTTGAVLTLGTKETSVVDADVLGRVDFYAPLEADGSDALLVAGSIVAQAEGTFSASNNATELLFQLGASEVATTQMSLSSTGKLTLHNSSPGNITIDNDGGRFIFQTPGGNSSFAYNFSDSADLTTISGVVADWLLVGNAVTFAPTAGAAVFTGLNLSPTINQTGTATGDIALLKIAPVLTAVTGTNQYLIQAGTSVSESLFTVDSSGQTGIGTGSPDGTLHVHTATAGSVTADSGADDLVVENSTTGGISIFVPDANFSQILFGSPSDTIGANIGWQHDGGNFIIGSNKAGATTAIRGDNAVTNLTLSGAIGSELATFVGVVSVDDTTDSTSTTTGSIHTDGGLGVAKDVFIGGDINVAGTGPHAIGGATVDYRNLLLRGAFTSGGSASEVSGFLSNVDITGASGDTISIAQFETTGSIVTQAVAETISDVVGVLIHEPDITNSTATITNASSLKIADAPTEGTNDYAFWVDSGYSRFDGNVGIGVTSGSIPLEVKGTGTGATVAKFTDVNTTGCTIADGGTIACSSDERLKKNIEDISYGLETLVALRPVLYNWKHEGDGVVRSLGFIAQEVEAIVPKLISTDEDGMKSLNTTGIIPIITKAVQELNIKIEGHEERIAILEDSITGGATTTLAGQGGVDLGDFAVEFFNSGLQSMVDGVAYMKGIVVETLKVGSSQKPVGITLFDEVTGAPYCVSVANGVQRITAGECVVVDLSATATSATQAGQSSAGGSSANLTATAGQAGQGDPVSPLGAPVITLNGEAIINLNINDTYTEEQATITDDVDDSVLVIISGTVDTSTAGVYIINYNATDSSGNNATEVTRTVNVIDPNDPQSQQGESSLNEPVDVIDPNAPVEETIAPDAPAEQEVGAEPQPEADQPLAETPAPENIEAETPEE